MGNNCVNGQQGGIDDGKGGSTNFVNSMVKEGIRLDSSCQAVKKAGECPALALEVVPHRQWRERGY
jgi:hypothetical protein